MSFLQKYIIKNFKIRCNTLTILKQSKFSSVASSTNTKATDKKKKNSGFDERKTETEALNNFFTTAEQARSLKVEFTEEELVEHKNIGREFQRQSTIRNNKMEKDLTNKIWLQQDALAALPENLRNQALEIDETPPPSDRPWPFFATPPIKDFDPQAYEGKKDNEEN